MVGHQGFGLGRGHAFTDRPLHAYQTNAHLILQQLTYRAHTPVAKVIDVVDLAVAILKLEQDLHHAEDILIAQNTGLQIAVDIQSLVHLQTTNRRQIVTIRFEEEVLEQVLCRFQRRRLTGTHHAVDVRVFSRRGLEKDERALQIDQDEIDGLRKDMVIERRIIEQDSEQRIRNMMVGQTVRSAPGLKSGGTITEEYLAKISINRIDEIVLDNDEITTRIEGIRNKVQDLGKRLQKRFENKVEKLERGDDLPPGVLKMVKVYIAVKRKLQPGDKMAGRHGNKGVISKINPAEDMPYLETGQPVDIVLNPLGVPSRMNVGQILETHLGWAGKELGKQVGDILREVQKGVTDMEVLREKMESIYDSPSQITDVKALSDGELQEMAVNLKDGVPAATPVFDGAVEEDIVGWLEKAGLPGSGQVRLIDGRTGEYFDRPVTVGYIYILKLHHLVDDKIHARSIGPYSLVTQQPLGGKAQFGGQRFGEMEVWALEAYGASYTLQEMLTVKSDDVAGRTKIYESIVKGDDAFEAGIPESFNVLVKELQSLALDVELQRSD
ncbi:MAG: hypothetical protein HQL50_15425 [Magnetococcales bacterium]|nr:hypothetical protein [Magnetococcales bacterium]